MLLAQLIEINLVFSSDDIDQIGQFLGKENLYPKDIGNWIESLLEEELGKSSSPRFLNIPKEQIEDAET